MPLTYYIRRIYCVGYVFLAISMPPSFPAMLLETGLSLSILKITDVGEYAATPVIAAPCLSRSVAPRRAVVFEANGLSLSA
jgi:hypothetical protein